MAALRIRSPFAADGSGPCSVRSETATGVNRPSSIPVARSDSSRLSRLVHAPARAWRRVREALHGRFLPKRLAGAFGLRPFSGAQTHRGPAAGQLGAPQRAAAAPNSQCERAAPLSPECAALASPCASTLARQGAAAAHRSGGLS